MRVKIEDVKPNDICLVVGGAYHVDQDLDQLRKKIAPHNLEDIFYIAVINDQIATFEERVDLFITLHGEKVGKWLQNRPQEWNWDFDVYNYRTHQHNLEYTEGLNFYELEHKWRGSSGLFAVQVALLELGFRKVILAGIPMTTEANKFRREKQWKQGDKYKEGWSYLIQHPEKQKFDINQHVRSMSGWTKEQLGEPSETFIFDCDDLPSIQLDYKASTTVSGGKGVPVKKKYKRNKNQKEGNYKARKSAGKRPIDIERERKKSKKTTSKKSSLKKEWEDIARGYYTVNFKEDDKDE